MLVSSKGVIDYSLIERSNGLVKSKGVVKFSYSKRSYQFFNRKGRLSNIVYSRGDYRI